MCDPGARWRSLIKMKEFQNLCPNRIASLFVTPVHIRHWHRLIGCEDRQAIGQHIVTRGRTFHAHACDFAERNHPARCLERTSSPPRRLLPSPIKYDYFLAPEQKSTKQDETGCQ